MKNITLFLAACMALSLSLAGHADSSARAPELTKWLDSEIQTINQALSVDEDIAASSVELPLLDTSNPPSEGWFLRNFWLRIRSQIGISIPGFLTFQIQPEAEFLFQRDFPEGWQAYKPAEKPVEAEVCQEGTDNTISAISAN